MEAEGDAEGGGAAPGGTRGGVPPYPSQGGAASSPPSARRKKREVSEPQVLAAAWGASWPTWCWRVACFRTRAEKPAQVGEVSECFFLWPTGHPRGAKAGRFLSRTRGGGRPVLTRPAPARLVVSKKSGEVSDRLSPGIARFLCHFQGTRKKDAEAEAPGLLPQVRGVRRECRRRCRGWVWQPRHCDGCHCRGRGRCHCRCPGRRRCRR